MKETSWENLISSSFDYCLSLGVSTKHMQTTKRKHFSIITLAVQNANRNSLNSIWKLFNVIRLPEPVDCIRFVSTF